MQSSFKTVARHKMESGGKDRYDDTGMGERDDSVGEQLEFTRKDMDALNKEIADNLDAISSILEECQAKILKYEKLAKNNPGKNNSDINVEVSKFFTNYVRTGDGLPRIRNFLSQPFMEAVESSEGFDDQLSKTCNRMRLVRLALSMKKTLINREEENTGNN